MISRNDVATNKEKIMFQLFFLTNDEDQNVKVVEVKEIDFDDIKRHLESGESVFITRKDKQKCDLNKISREPWYFSHV